MEKKIFYIVEYGLDEKKEEDLVLIKIEGNTAYEYFNKEWHENPSLYSMLYDPGPYAEHINEIRAKKIMNIIDKYH